MEFYKQNSMVHFFELHLQKRGYKERNSVHVSSHSQGSRLVFQNMVFQLIFATPQSAWFLEKTQIKEVFYGKHV